MSRQRVAVPAMQPGDLTSPTSAHFGHCDVFAVLEIENGQIIKQGALPNIDHSQGGCLMPVMYLAEHGVNAIIVSGMGLRPLMGFRSTGIKVFLGTGTTVQEAVGSYLKGELEEMSEKAVCGGGDHCSQV